MHIAILGRQSSLSLAELECMYGADAITPVGDIAALVETESLDIQQLGGIPKAGRLITELKGDWRRVSQAIEHHYAKSWQDVEHKITLGISAYGNHAPAPRQIQALGLSLKKARKHHPGSLRLIPNTESTLSTATSHHNKLGLSPHKIELLIVEAPNGTTYLAESTGAQNITALAARDQARPRTDAFVGMLPPKLALMMINMSQSRTSDTSPLTPTSAQAREPRETGSTVSRATSTNRQPREHSALPAERGQDKLAVSDHAYDHEVLDGDGGEALTLLDPFCGTGVILQEALLTGYRAYGTDLSEKMVAYSTANLEWLSTKHPRSQFDYQLYQGDATNYQWSAPIDSVVAETYLGQPFSAPPSPAKLREVRGNCNHIISSFLRNIHKQVHSGTPMVLAVPAWRDTNGHFTHLPLTHQLEELGYARRQLRHTRPDQLLYYRPDQVVARELLLIEKL